MLLAFKSTAYVHHQKRAIHANPKPTSNKSDKSMIVCSMFCRNKVNMAEILFSNDPQVLNQ
jgi:hypothetical protein